MSKSHTEESLQGLLSVHLGNRHLQQLDLPDLQSLPADSNIRAAQPVLKIADELCALFLAVKFHHQIIFTVKLDEDNAALAIWRHAEGELLEIGQVDGTVGLVAALVREFDLLAGTERDLDGTFGLFETAPFRSCTCV